MRIRDRYKAYDAEVKFNIGYGRNTSFTEEQEGCACGDVMTGRIKPHACPQFGKGCTPEMPLGALMVSSEGACAAYPDERLGERVCAFVALKPGESLTLDELNAHLKAHDIATYKLPERLQVVAALPRNALNKVLRRELGQLPPA